MPIFYWLNNDQAISDDCKGQNSPERYDGLHHKNKINIR